MIVQAVTKQTIHSENYIFEKIVRINLVFFFILVETKDEALK